MNGIVSIETQQRMAALREKTKTGDLTLDECKEAIAFLRQERLAMPPSGSKPRTKTPQKTADDMLGELGI